MRVVIAGKRWQWLWWPFGPSDNDGECDPPTTPNKAIRVRNSLDRRDRQYRLMEVAIHEALHALNWHIDEETVTHGGEDIARLLWNLGYRRL